jgi:hypothetical protein
LTITIWVCPNGCGNYFGSSSAGDLASQMNTDLKHNPTFTRAQCPTCRTLKPGEQAPERVPLRVVVPVPKTAQGAGQAPEPTEPVVAGDPLKVAS